MNGATGVVGTDTSSPAATTDPSTDGRTTRSIAVTASRRARRGQQAVRRTAAHQWIAGHRRLLMIGDLVSAGVGILLVAVVRTEPINDPSQLLAIALPLLWLLAVAVVDGYNTRIIGVGSEEYQRCAKALVAVLAAVGFASYALKLEVARSYVLIALPVAVVLSLALRYALRKRLHRIRSNGQALTSVVAVGDADAVIDLARRMHREAYLGMQVVGACVPRAEMADAEVRAQLDEAGVVPLGDLDSVVTAANRTGADAVAVTSSREIGPRKLKELSWQLERTDADLVVSPGLVEVAGPRLHIRPVTGLPLLHVEKPEFAGNRRLVKGIVDRSAAVFGLLVLSPLLAGLWLAVRLSSSGPAMFTQTRVGKDGREFRIWKFRSMYTDAEARLASLSEQNQHDQGPLFKMRRDPRITPIGRVIRRLSLDELPQLVNVVNGTMSLVGPRPPLPSEVEKYGLHVHRRLLVRPGLTGLWQVSGRSDLSWDESVRLDLRYVENWSLGADLLILWKTLSAVVKGSGAY